MIRKLLKDLDHSIENKGDKIIITLKGDKEKLAAFERKLKALKELHEDMCCGGNDDKCC